MNELKQSYFERAEAIEGWQKLTRSQLGYMYCKYKYEEHNDVLAEACLSGLIYKFWNVISHNYYNQGQKKIMSFEDCYDYTVDAIMYVLENHVWDNPDSSLYQDPNAPEKAINVRIVSYRNNFLIHEFRDKRALNTIAFSLDNLIESALGDEYTPKLEYVYNYLREDMNNLIIKLFNERQYIKCVILYYLIIACNNIPDLSKKIEIIPRDILIFLKGLLSDSFIEEFSEYVKRDKPSVLYAMQSIYFYFENITQDDDIILSVINALQADKDLIKLYHEQDDIE